MKTTAFDIVAQQDLTGQVFLITGAYAGLGAIQTKALLQAGATVIATGRNAKTQAEFAQNLADLPELSFEPHQLYCSATIDLGDLASVQAFATHVKEKYPKIDCLVNNAGVMRTPPGKTKDGFETQMGVNVIGHFLLAKLLVDITIRQVWLSSKGHIRYGAPGIDYDAITEVNEKDYVSRWRYQQAKLGDILLSKEFAKRYPHLKAVSLHPGGVKTNLGRYMTLGQKLKFIVQNPLTVMSMVSPEEGAATQTLVSIMPENELTNGAYYADCKVTAPAKSGEDMADAACLFDYCDKATHAFQ